MVALVWREARDSVGFSQAECLFSLVRESVKWLVLPMGRAPSNSRSVKRDTGLEKDISRGMGP